MHEMSNPNAVPPEHTKWKPGQSGNPKGKPKGTLHISTHIQNLLEDENFTIDNWMNSGKKYQGVPIKAIITVAIYQALQGDNKWAEWLAKHGYGNTLNINVDNPIQEILNKYGKVDGGVDDVPAVEETES